MTFSDVGFSRRSFLTSAGATVAAIAVTSSAPLAFAGQGPHAQAPLGYAFDALSPHIDAKTMELHYSKHHAGYVKGLNTALQDHGEAAKLSMTELLAKLNEMPESIRQKVQNTGGGHANHTMFWSIMGGGETKPSGALKTAIERDFGDLATMKVDFKKAGLGRFGSGWVFVVVDGEGKLSITSKPNQDTPLMDGARALMGNDVWEHAYYLNYQNRRGDYLDAWWNVVNWNVVSERYQAAEKGVLEI